MSERKQGKKSPAVSRRDFLTKSALSAGAAATLGAVTAAPAAAADAAPNMPPIRLADEFTKSINEPLVPLEFGGERGLSGAEVFAR